MLDGLVEVVSRNFATGWARSFDGAPAHVYASLGKKILGWAVAEIARQDLIPATKEDGDQELGRGFIVVFDMPIEPMSLKEVSLTLLENATNIPHGRRVKYDERDPVQIFILGSPRSGTSELGATLTTVLDLPWVGEGHAAPSFHNAAIALNGDSGPPTSDLIDFMSRTSLGNLAEVGMRQAYYWVHGASSFVDKTPGSAMIKAAPFLARCFPEAKFIFLRRNGISNVLSRMAKFGGPFDEHCSDWAGAMTEWSKVKASLPHYIEIDQERMLAQPNAVAHQLGLYLGVEWTLALGASLRLGERERTGAGIGRAKLAETGWTDIEIRQFREICGDVMAESGYSMD